MRVDVAGFGAWGLAFGALLARRGAEVCLLTCPHEDPDSVNSGTHPLFPDADLPGGLRARAREENARPPDLLVWAVPSRFTEDWLASGVLERAGEAPLLVLSKGLAPAGFSPVALWLGERTAGPAGVLSGPNFAHEVLAGLPAAAALAGPEEAFAPLLGMLNGGPFRTYQVADFVGVAWGGVLKNVYAIGGGMVDGARLGENARAAFLTRALVEMARVFAHAGASRATLYGLAGIGDLTLTATSPRSRNYALGRSLAEGDSVDDAVAGLVGESEGLRTARRLATLARSEGLDLPLALAVQSVLAGDTDVPGAVEALLARPLPNGS